MGNCCTTGQPVARRGYEPPAPSRNLHVPSIEAILEENNKSAKFEIASPAMIVKHNYRSPCIQRQRSYGVSNKGSVSTQADWWCVCDGSWKDFGHRTWNDFKAPKQSEIEWIIGCCTLAFQSWLPAYCWLTSSAASLAFRLMPILHCRFTTLEIHPPQSRREYLLSLPL